MGLRNIFIAFKKLFRKEFNRKYLIFLVFFGLASLLWFLNALGKQYDTTISIQIEYQNIPLTKALLCDVPQKIDIDVNASGYSLIKYFVSSRKKRIVVNIGKFLANNFEWRNTLYIPINSNNDILGRFDNSIKIRKVTPDTIVFKFADISSKKVIVKPIVAISFEQQYELQNPISVNPEYVMIYGAKQILDKIDTVFTVLLEKDKVYESFSQNISLQKISNVNYSYYSCVMRINVEKFTEQTFSIPIVPIHVPDSLVIDLMKEHVSYTFLVGLSKSKYCKISDFKAIADYDKLDVKTGNIPVEIIKKPNFVRFVKQDPLKIGYIIDMK